MEVVREANWKCAGGSLSPLRDLNSSSDSIMLEGKGLVQVVMNGPLMWCGGGGATKKTAHVCGLSYVSFHLRFA